MREVNLNNDLSPQDDFLFIEMGAIHHYTNSGDMVWEESNELFEALLNHTRD